MFKFKKNLLILIIGISLGASNLAQATCHSRDFNFPTVKVAIDEVNASSSNLMALQNLMIIYILINLFLLRKIL
jgi:hypothetical protein